MTYILLLSVDSPRSPNSPRSSTKNIKEYFNYLPSNLKVSKSTRVNSAQKSHCWGFLFDILLFWWILCVLFFPSAPFEFLFPYILTKQNFCFNNFVNLNLFLWITKEKVKMKHIPGFMNVYMYNYIVHVCNIPWTELNF